MNKIKTVPDALTGLGDIYRERNKLYADNYLRFGNVMMGLFPNGVHLRNVEEHNRFALLTHMQTKLTRYANSLHTGGHADSLDDIAVYAQMAQEHDALVRAEKANVKRRIR